VPVLKSGGGGNAIAASGAAAASGSGVGNDNDGGSGAGGGNNADEANLYKISLCHVEKNATAKAATSNLDLTCISFQFVRPTLIICQYTQKLLLAGKWQWRQFPVAFSAGDVSLRLHYSLLSMQGPTPSLLDSAMDIF